MDFITNLFFGTPVDRVSASDVQKKLVQKQKPLLLDVRQPEEFRSGHIPGAKLIPLGELRTRFNELPKNQEIICICHSGNRSLNAARQLTGAGYKTSSLNGGMIAWSRAGMPVTRGKA
jgi:rhodanese-related sulfurtransferase